MEMAYGPYTASGLAELRQRISDLISVSQGYTEIVERASRLLKCPLSFWDHRGNLIAATPPQNDVFAALIREFGSLRARASGREPVRLTITDAEPSVVALAVADGCGPDKLLVFVPVDHESAIDTCRAVASDLGHVMVVEGQRQRAVVITEERLRTSFRDSLLDPLAFTGGGFDRIAERARTLGYELASAYWVIVAEPRATKSPDSRTAVCHMLAGRIARFGDRRTLTIEQGERMVVLLPEERLERERFAGLRDSLIATMRSVGAEYDAVLCAGMSENSVVVGQIAAEVDRVRRSLDLNRSLGYRHELVVRDAIRPYRLLMAIPEKRELLDYWGETIRELHQYDLLNGTTLIDTLEVFFATNYNAIEASRKLYVHRNTMTRRLRRIEDVLSVDLSDSETLFRLQLALRVHHIVISTEMQR